MISDVDLRILEHAEKLELGQIKRADTTREILGMSPARYTQRLMHLVQRDDVVSDPRWTMMAHRIQRAMTSAAQSRASRTFGQRTA